jgi:hypothetical protein
MRDFTHDLESSMSQSLAIARARAASRQKHCCYYCGLPMWDEHPEAFMARYDLTRRQAAQLRCTAEHLVPRCQGGFDTARNIVAACAYCNRKRHARRCPSTPAAYRAFVRQRMQGGRWSLAALPTALRSEFQERRVHAPPGCGGTSRGSFPASSSREAMP